MAQSKTVNLIPNDSLPHVNISQNDVGREIVFNLVEGSAAYEIPSGATVKLQGTKPSGFGYSLDGSYDGSEVTIVTDATMSDEWGRIPSELVITSGDTVIGTTNLLLVVEKSPHPDGTTDGQAEAVIPVLTLLVERIEAAAESIKDLSVEAETLDYTEEAYATYDEDENKITFGIPKGYNGYEIEGTIGFTDTGSTGDVVITMS